MYIIYKQVLNITLKLLLRKSNPFRELTIADGCVVQDSSWIDEYWHIFEECCQRPRQILQAFSFCIVG